MNKQKKLLLSVLIIAAVGGGAIGATIAYFTANRTVSSSRFTAGTLDLDVAANGSALEPFVIDNIGENGDISGEKTWTVRNTGTLPGRLLLRLKNLANYDNGCNDQEKGAEPLCDADNEGEMGAVITANVALDGTDVVSSTLATDQQGVIGNSWNALAPIILQPGEEREVKVYWATGEDEYGNEIQSDSLEFDMDFRLIQQINGPTPANN
jgi:predicted ribosomally synthesized peptide with SipW-like signal peptide